MASKRLAETQMGREPRPSDGVGLPSDIPRQATAAQMAARKSLHSPNPALQPSGFENLNFTPPTGNASDGSAPQQSSFNFSQPQQQNGGFQPSFSQFSSAPQTNGFTNPISASFPPATAPQPQSHNFAPSSTSFSFSSGQNNSISSNPFANLKGLDTPANYFSGIFGNAINNTTNENHSAASQPERNNAQTKTTEPEKSLLPASTGVATSSTNTGGLFAFGQPASSSAQSNQEQAKPAEASSIQNNSSIKINGVSQENKMSSFGSPFNMNPSIQGFGQGNQNQNQPSEQTGSLFKPSSKPGTFLNTQNKPSEQTNTLFKPSSTPGTFLKTQDTSGEQAASAFGKPFSTPGPFNQNQANAKEQRSSLFSQPFTTPGPFNQNQNKASEQSSSLFSQPFSTSAPFTQSQEQPSGQFGSIPPQSVTPSFGHATQTQESAPPQSNFFSQPTSTTGFGQSSQNQGSAPPQSNSFSQPASAPGFGQSNQSQEKPPVQPNFFSQPTSTSGFGQSTQNQNNAPPQLNFFSRPASTSGFGQSNQSQESPPVQPSFFSQPASTSSLDQSMQGEENPPAQPNLFSQTASTPSFNQPMQGQENPPTQPNSFSQTTSTPSIDQSTQSQETVPAQPNFSSQTASTPNFGQSMQSQDKPPKSSFFQQTPSTPSISLFNQNQDKSSSQSVFSKPSVSTSSFGQFGQNQDKQSAQSTVQTETPAFTQGEDALKSTQPASSGSLFNPLPPTPAQSFSQPSLSTSSIPEQIPSEPQMSQEEPSSTQEVASATMLQREVSHEELLTALNYGLLAHLQEQPLTADWSPIMKFYFEQVQDIERSSLPMEQLKEVPEKTPVVGPGALNEPTKNAPEKSQNPGLDLINASTSGQPALSPFKSGDSNQPTNHSSSGFNIFGASTKRKADDDLHLDDVSESYSEKKSEFQAPSFTPTPKANVDREPTSQTSSLMRSILEGQRQEDQTPQKTNVSSSTQKSSVFSGGASSASSSIFNPNTSIGKENTPPVASPNKTTQAQSTLFGSKPTTSSLFQSSSPAKQSEQNTKDPSQPDAKSPFSWKAPEASAAISSKPPFSFGLPQPSASASPFKIGPPATGNLGGLGGLGGLSGGGGSAMAQFGQLAKKSEEAEKEKRKLEDMDSDEDEAEWEKRDAEEQAAKRAKLLGGGNQKLKFVKGQMILVDKDDAEPSEAEERSVVSEASVTGSEAKLTEPEMKPTESESEATESETQSVKSVQPQAKSTSLFTPQPTKSEPSYSLGGSIFNQPQTAFAKSSTSNIFAHLGQGNNAADTGEEDSDEETLESAARKAPKSLKKPASTAPATEGGSLFSRISKPQETSTQEQDKSKDGLFAFSEKKTAVEQEKTPSSDSTSSAAKSTLFGAASNKPTNEGEKSSLFSNTQPTSNLFGFGKSAPTSDTSAEKSASTPFKSNLFGFDKSQGAAGDQTWKPETPIKFGTSTTTQPTFQYTAPTPNKPAEGSDDTASDANTGDATPPKPRAFPFGLDGANDDPGPTSAPVGFAFGPASSSTNRLGGTIAASSLFPPSLASSPFASSGPLSRSSTPGLTTDGEGSVAATDAASVQDDAASASDVLLDDLSGLTDAEREAEDMLFEVKAKVMEFRKADAKAGDAAAAGWHNRGQGPLRLLKNKETGAVRVLMRSAPAGNVVVNSRLVKNVEHKKVRAKTVQMVEVNEEGGLTSLMVRVASDSGADELVKVCEENKPKE
ncbi:MAG: hypothetical protein M1822_002610 [Bathelium mastoideum]|nr:MAG: hypothetical protein M1822_002610 [Bathelium mastoideum]